MLAWLMLKKKKKSTLFVAENAQVVERQNEKLNDHLRSDLNLNNFQTKRNHINTCVEGSTSASKPGFWAEWIRECKFKLSSLGRRWRGCRFVLSGSNGAQTWIRAKLMAVPFHSTQLCVGSSSKQSTPDSLQPYA